MALSWRDAGLTYVRYSNICAQVLRQALKAHLKDDAEKRNNSIVKCVLWINGNPTQRTED